MIEIYLKLILFFVISLLYFYSVLGFGKVTSDNNSNYFESYLDGTIILLILSYLIYLTIGTNHTINLIILFVGLIFYFKENKKYKIIKYKNIILLFLSLFSILIISKTHEDFNGYHYFSIYEIFNHNLRLGVSNLNIRFFQSSLLAHNQALLVFPYFDFKLVHLSSFFIYFSIIGYFIIILFSINLKNNEVFYSILCLFIMLIKFNRLSEYGYDYIAQFILLIVFHKIYFLNSNDNETIKAIIYFLLTVLIKPITLFFIPIMTYIIYKKDFNFYRRIPRIKYFLIFSLFFILISSSFFKTGCLFYPLNKTCFPIEKISWSEKEIVEEYTEITSLWAKGFMWQEDTKYQRINDPNLYKKNFNWLKYWIELHFFYKVFEFLLIIFGSIIIINTYFSKDKLNFHKNNKDKIILILLSLLSIIFWLWTVPQFRFGFSSMIIFSYLLKDYFFNTQVKFEKKKFLHIFILGLVVLNFKNLNRINSEFERNDFYTFKNFPFYTEIEIKNDYSNLNIKKFFHIKILNKL